MKIWTHISAFLMGALTVALMMILILLKGVKPVINTQSYVEQVETQLKKLKVSGEDNATSLAVDIAKQEKPRKFLGIIKRKPKKP